MADDPKKRRRSNRIPKLRRHATGQGVVTLGGKDFYCGKFGTPQCEAKYRRFVADWIASDRKILPAPKTVAQTELGISIAELCLRFSNWVRATYIDEDGAQKSMHKTLEWASKYLSARYGLMPAAAFGRREFFETRDHFIQRRLSRSTVNLKMSRIKAIFTWGANREMIPVDVLARLATIKKLAPGEEGVRELPRVEPVSDEVVDKTLPYLRPDIKALIRILRLSGARIGEVLVLRPCDLEETEEKGVFAFRPFRHKTQAHSSRVIYLGPKAMKVLRPLIKDVPPEDFVFRGVRKKTRLNPMDVHIHVKRAAERAKVKHWHPHQLRHSRLSEERRQGNIDVAQLLAGHTSSRMTERYAAPDVAKAIKAAKKRG
jgi:integrase